MLSEGAKLGRSHGSVDWVRSKTSAKAGLARLRRSMLDFLPLSHHPQRPRGQAEREPSTKQQETEIQKRGIKESTASDESEGQASGVDAFLQRLNRHLLSAALTFHLSLGFRAKRQRIKQDTRDFSHIRAFRTLVDAVRKAGLTDMCSKMRNSQSDVE
ncbi:hypothetical protein AOLI_G00282680 [Acnodon oligacanthus]